MQAIQNYEIVSVEVKIINEREVEEIKPGLLKQDYRYIAADCIGTVTVTAWGDNVGTLTTHDLYRLTGAIVRIFDSMKYLYNSQGQVHN